MKRASQIGVFFAAFGIPLAVSWYHANRRGGYDFGSRFSPAWIFVYGAFFLLSGFLFGIPSLVVRPRQAVLGSAIAALTPLAVASILFVIYDPRVPRFIVVTSPVLIGAAFLAFSMLNVLRLKQSELSDLVVAVLDDAEVDTLRYDATRAPERRFSLLEVLAHSTIDECSGQLLIDTTTKKNANLIVLSERAQESESTVKQAAYLHENGVRVRSLASFYDEWLGKLPVQGLDRTSLWFDIRDLHEQYYARWKRLMDVAFATVMTLPLLIAIPLVFVGNRFGNRGPLFFKQTRVGHQGHQFTIWKFRTMTVSSTVGGSGVWTIKNDPRVTPFGKLLRLSHLDELPQVINVMTGSLSVVGPRPEQPHYVEELTKSIPFFGMRHAVRPGITGWAQVKYPYGASELDALEKLQYDLYYLRHQSLSLDLRVCARTARTIFFGQGR
jgi:lipopolysaccharide/colanic/teichoic acid biosynthesis glycosyltransferase